MSRRTLIRVCVKKCYYRSRRWKPGEEIVVFEDEKYPSDYFKSKGTVDRDKLVELAASGRQALNKAVTESMTAEEKVAALAEEKQELLTLAEKLEISVNKQLGNAKLKNAVSAGIVKLLTEEYGVKSVHPNLTLEELIVLLEKEEKALED